LPVAVLFYLHKSICSAVSQRIEFSKHKYLQLLNPKESKFNYKAERLQKKKKERKNDSFFTNVLPSKVPKLFQKY